MILLLFILIFFNFVDRAYAILDGRVNPVFVSTHYTFTNFEWARGRVYFQDGFDLPINGTAIIDITTPVQGTINFDNSTLIMNNHLDLKGYPAMKGQGYINFNSNRLLFEDTQELFDGSDKFIFTSDGEIHGLGYSTKFRTATAAMVFTSNVQSFTFSNILLREVFNGFFFTASNAPKRLVLNNTKLIFGLALTLKPAELVIKGSVIAQAKPTARLTIQNTLLLDAFATFNIRSGITLNVNSIAGSETTGGIILENAKIVFTSTATSQSMFESPAPGVEGKGRLITQGPCELNTKSTARLFIPSTSVLQLTTGSRLTIEPSSHLTIY